MCENVACSNGGISGCDGKTERVTLSHLEMKWQESPCQMLGNTLILNFSVLGLWEMNFLSELMSLWYSV